MTRTNKGKKVDQHKRKRRKPTCIAINWNIPIIWALRQSRILRKTLVEASARVMRIRFGS